MGFIHVGEYEFSDQDKLGQGGFGSVFKGRKSNNPSHIVAVKVVQRTSIVLHGQFLEKEIRILRELTSLHHPNLVGMYDCVEKDQYVCMVIEYCNGGDFASYLRTNGQLSERTIKLFLRQIAEGMSAIHKKGIVHRDIKPQNFLLTHHVAPPRKPQPSDIMLKIADFGISRFLTKGSMASTHCGTEAYMAPEVIIGLKYDFKADLWSLGVTFYKALTGNFPFEQMPAHQLKALHDQSVRLRPKMPEGTSQELQDLLNNLLRLNPHDRMSFNRFYHHPFVQHSSPAKGNHSGPSAPAPVNKSHIWVDASAGDVPHGAVVSGRDRFGQLSYVARAHHEHDIIPGILVPSDHLASVSWGGREHNKYNYQVLVGNFKNWMTTHGANVPSGALVGGETESGEPLFIGRVSHKGSTITGKVQRSHGVCYIPYEGNELAFTEYEILIKC